MKQQKETVVAKTLDDRFIQDRAYTILEEAYGSDARFKPGQLEAIVSVVSGRNSLVIQKTGWGKSLVYFVATRILRENGAAATLIISPLLALMGDQIESARNFGVDAVTMNSDNKADLDDIFAKFDRVDALIVSPERLANEKFMERLAEVREIELVVIDEVHCISDWGHDFRPDYQRVSKLIDGLPGNVVVLGTTATANNRVISDIRQQLGDDLNVIRGDLIRENLAIQVNPSQPLGQRLAWLARNLIDNEVLSTGQGVIYCLKKSDCRAVSDFLSRQGVSILPYYADMGEDEQGEKIEKKNLARFIAGETRVLAATVKLGMGYDKSDIRFIIHFQLPKNLIDYYQQIGRAGRDGKLAYAFLLHGEEDEETNRYFIDNAQTSPDLLEKIIRLAKSGATWSELWQLNAGGNPLKQALKYLLVHNYLYMDKVNGKVVYCTNIGKSFDAAAERARQERLTEMRYAELRALNEYIDLTDCFMQRVAAEFDAPDAKEICGICSNCRGGFIVPVSTDPELTAKAARYLEERHGTINPRKKWSSLSSIPVELQMQQGWILCDIYYSTMGQTVKRGKYSLGFFPQELVNAAEEFLREKVMNAGIDCLVPVPSLGHPRLVPDFAKALGDSLGIPCFEAVQKIPGAVEQKSLNNSVMQEANVRNFTRVINPRDIEGRNVLLVDDMTDSRWTLAVIASELLEAGASSVYPFTLSRTGNGN